MRTRTGKLIADLNKQEGALTSVPVPDRPTTTALNSVAVPYQDTTIVDENATKYVLYPYELNEVPIFTENIYNGSTPKIISEQAYSPANSDVMYYDEDGIVKVLAGTSFQLRVQAQQPNILNVENGVPLIFQGTTELQYEWLRDGRLAADFILGDEQAIRRDRVEPDRSTLTFYNVSTRLAGQYTCIVRNDIGEVTSEVIELQVIDPQSPDDTFFKKNLIQNGSANDGTNNWTVLLGDVGTRTFASPATELELKRPNTPVFAHHIGEIYPHPTNIKFNGIKGYNPANLASKGSSYFRRDSLKPYVNGGTRLAVMYQDVDLTEIQDMIAGRVYGCNGVRAYIGSILGNAVSYFRTVADLIGPELRYDPTYYYQGAPRLSYENAALAGLPNILETVSLFVQEFEGATPLRSVQYDPLTDTTTNVDSIRIIDPITKALTSSNIPDIYYPPVELSSTIIQTDGSQWDLAPIGPSKQGKILNMYQQLYPSRNLYYTHGQYAEYQDSIIRVLNPRTNKIRFTVQFAINDMRLTETNPVLVDGNIREVFWWEKPLFKLLLKTFPTTYRDIIYNNANASWKEKGFAGIIAQLESRPMVSSLGLLLEPLTDSSVDVRDFRNEIASIPTKQEEAQKYLRPKPQSPLTPEVSFTTVAQNTTGLNTTLNFGQSFGLRFFRKYESVRINDNSWSPNIANTFYETTYNQDDEYMDGRITVFNSKGETLYDGDFHYESGEIKYSSDSGAGPYSDGGLGFVRIRVIAYPYGSGTDGSKENNQRKNVPFLSLQLVNTKSQLQKDDDYRLICAWPAWNLGDRGPTPFLEYSQPGNYAGASYVRQDTGFLGGTRLNTREINVYVPANCLSFIVAGVRNNDNGTDSDDNPVVTKFYFNNDDQLVYELLEN
jgi:hypothetical protein